MTTQQKRTLPADVFDALELSALIYGGIGAGCLSLTRTAEGDATEPEPHCVIGHAMFLDGYRIGRDMESVIAPDESPVVDALVAAFPGLACDGEEYHDFITDVETENDNKVADILSRRDDADVSFGRITWKQWCKTMRVTRGDN